MSKLITEPNVARPDDIYQQLVEMHAGLSDAESMKMYARLVLILVNHIGSFEIISEAIEMARRPGAGRPGLETIGGNAKPVFERAI